MQAILFCPTTSELFLPDWPRPLAAPSHSACAVAPLLIHRLRALGWPARARLVSRKAPQSAGSVAGTLVQLIDALPILAQPPDAAPDLSLSPDLRAWHRAAYLALQQVGRGQLLPQLSARGPKAWEARWRLSPIALTPTALAGTGPSPRGGAAAQDRATVLRILADLPEAIAIPEDARTGGSAAVVSGPRLLQRFLDACADTLVREASRRGALVRLRGCSASTWEQRMVRALGEDRALFFWPPPVPSDGRASCDDDAPHPLDPAAIMAEVNGWAADLAPGALDTLPAGPTHAGPPRGGALFPSPAGWSAPESLVDVLRRMARPAALLSQTLIAGQAAPRTLAMRPTNPITGPAVPMHAPAPSPSLWGSRRLGVPARAAA